MTSFVAVRAFESEDSARDAASRLESMGVTCSVLSTPNITNRSWLLVPASHDVHAQQTLRQFPTETIAKSVVLNSIEEREITEYAAKAAARPLRIGRILWLLVVLWPIGLGWTNIFAYIGLAVSVAFLWLISDAFGCPCCGHFEPMESGKATHCARCGISGAKSAR